MNGYLNIPAEYAEQYVYQYVGYVKKKANGRLNGGCPFCHEGKSWQRDARFWYDPAREDTGKTVQCYNCGYRNTSYGFITDIAGLTYHEIKAECEEYDIVPRGVDSMEALTNEFKPSTLPDNCINLLDPVQISFYKDNEIVNLALDYISKRLLLNACNRPKTFYLSLDDYTHKNRLIIPYYDEGKIVWYQSRRLLNDGSPKYLSKAYSEKSIYNLDNIDEELLYIFMFEGAIDSMFVENASCVSGITEEGEFMLTHLQQDQLNRYPFHEIVWILDSPYLDDTANTKTRALVDKGEKVFKWPSKYGEYYKDFNEMAVDGNIQKIPQDFILRNLYKSDDVGDQIAAAFTSRL